MPRDALDQHYYPGARVRLLLRLEEFGATDTPAVPSKPPQLREGADEPPALSVTPVDGRLVLDSKPGGGPQDKTSSNDGRTWPIDLVPWAVSIERNGVRTADTCSLELKFADFPIDPRLVRSCAVQVYLGTLSEEQFRESTTAVLAEAWTDAQGRARNNLRFEGWADDYRLECSEDGEPSVVVLECTDNTRLLIDQPAPPKLRVKGDAPIDRAVADYLAAFPQFAGLEVEYRPAGQPVPVLDKVLLPTSGGKKTGAPDGKEAAQSKGAPVDGGGGKQSVWDYLTDCCGMVGCVVRVEGVRIVIQLPRTLYAQGFQGRADDTFTGRVLPSGRTLRGRLLQYGQNLLSLQFAKKFARTVSSNVEVRCYSSRLKKTLIARHPKKAESNKKINPGETADTNFTVYRVQGIEDEPTLRQIAQSVYESLGRGELEVTLATHDMASVGGDAVDPDLLDLQAGDMVNVEMPSAAGGPTPGGGQESEEKAKAARAEARLIELGFSAGFAAAYATAAANLYYATNFYTRTCSLGWREDSGFEFNAQLVNYIEARGDKKLPDGEEPDPSKSMGQKAAPVKVQAPAPKE